MRISRMQSITSFWKRLSFKDNISKMRLALVDYLTSEGVDCQIVDGVVIFEYDGSNFTAEFNLNDNYPECKIVFVVEDDDYESLDLRDKTYISDRVNTDMENHSIVYTFSDCIKLVSSYYFSNRDMMLNLFCRHFADLTQSLDLTLKLTQCKVNEHKNFKGRRIGFNTEFNQQPEHELGDVKVAAKA